MTQLVTIKRSVSDAVTALEDMVDTLDQSKSTRTSQKTSQPGPIIYGMCCG
jgi:hypothetical protein